MGKDNLSLFVEPEISHTKPSREPLLKDELRPLAESLRPKSWEEFQGLELLDQPLVRQLKSAAGKPPSLLLWGPPGSGKTTFAKLIGRSFNYPFVELSAVLGGVKELRDIVANAEKLTVPTILFMDEIHRFNKAQQDALLPHVESGTLILVGATTENPSFYLNGALLSRCKVLVFPGLNSESLVKIIERAASVKELKFSKEVLDLIVEYSAGDARRAINLIEGFFESMPSTPHKKEKSAEIGVEALNAFIKDSKIPFHDRSGEEHYNVVSAFIKSLRGSDPDAALYWGFRMIEAGEDPLFVIRRMIIFASEDIGNADPRALTLAVSTAEAFERIGLPEGKIPIAQCITYLAAAPKSNRSYLAMHEAIAAANEKSKVAVPLHLRNAPTGLMKALHYGRDYQYPHNYEGGRVEGVEYLPPELKGRKFYHPSEIGFEIKLAERLKGRE